ncbi:TRAP transporter substrate-binding protein [Leptospira sp. severe_002]|uniref:TRAP transporter substrate-binding protein n=1 Tax=Leptospira sp. severe_002 TaxID=2838237 RepID=UPI001E5C3D35|nr:TRAP transporter substrate-binding protein [Leptospira sp. severe_002]
MTVRICALLAALLVATPVQAQPPAQPIPWDLIDEYPATAIPGEADSFFAEAVKRRTEGRVVINTIPDAKSGLRTREQIKAVTEGRHAMANTLAGALADESPFFLLSSLPFVTASATDARALATAAMPLYDKLFVERKQKVLFVTPWPPSGIWSAKPVNGLDVLRALKVRTYDKGGTDLFSQVSAAASVVSFADLPGKLDSGEINAVLSSGDGGAARKLWTHLPNFSEITYAVPLSFGTVSLEAFNKLDARDRAAIEEAGRETTERQWAAMAGRVARNYTTMRENKVAIDEKPPADVMNAMRAAAAKSVAEWRVKAGPEAAALLDAQMKK